MPDEVIDSKARQDVAVLQAEVATIKEGLGGIKTTLDHIFVSLLVGMAGAAGAGVYNWAFHLHP